jgi:hypothetical protein
MTQLQRSPCRFALRAVPFLWTWKWKCSLPGVIRIGKPKISAVEVLGLVLLAGIAVGIAANLRDITRYIRITRM